MRDTEGLLALQRLNDEESGIRITQIGMSFEAIPSMVVEQNTIFDSRVHRGHGVDIPVIVFRAPVPAHIHEYISRVFGNTLGDTDGRVMRDGTPRELERAICLGVAHVAELTRHHDLAVAVILFPFAGGAIAHQHVAGDVVVQKLEAALGACKSWVRGVRVGLAEGDAGHFL